MFHAHLVQPNFREVGTAPVHRVTFVLIVDTADVGPLLTAELVSPMHVTTPVVEVLLVVVEYVQPDSVSELVAPAPAVTHAAPAPVAEYVAAVSAVTYAALASVDEFVSPAPALAHAAPGGRVCRIDLAPAMEATPNAVEIPSPLWSR